jgi:SAM-dependent methyltransferase
VAARTFDRLGLTAGEHVLEVGCGTGVLLPRLASEAGPTGRVVALDHSEAFLGQARERIEAAGLGATVTAVLGDAQALPFPDAQFDATHCERVLMHVEDPDLAIREMVRVTRPGGRVVAAEVFAEGATIDHPDRELAQITTRGLVSGIRNPDVGMTLRRRFIESGLVDVGGEIVGLFEESIEQDEADEIAVIARALAARGAVDRARAQAYVEVLEARRAAGTYCGLALIVVCSGRVPGPG